MSYDRIYGKLFQGSEPPHGSALREHGFDVLVLCAEEIQPSEDCFPGIEVIRAPNDDGFKMTDEQGRTATAAAKAVVDRLRAGKTVLVTCAMGINRSGLVSALSIHYLTGRSGRDCVRLVQTRRKGALRNPTFVTALSRLKARFSDPRLEAFGYKIP